jgi:hypothetical protein
LGISENDKQEPRQLAPGFLVLTLGGTVLLAVTFVQHGHVQGWVEIAVRTVARFAGLLAVPFLVVTAAKNWTKTLRMKLPAWRNGLALTSIVLVSLIWLSGFVTSTAYAGPQREDFVFHVDPLSLLGTLLFSDLLAGLLATALQRRSRLLILSATLLLWSGIQSGIFF